MPQTGSSVRSISAVKPGNEVDMNELTFPGVGQSEFTEKRKKEEGVCYQARENENKRSSHWPKPMRADN